MKFSSESKSKIGSKIRKLRELRNYTQEYVAQKIEMTATGYGKIERGDNDLSFQKLEKISAILGIGILEILSFENDDILKAISSTHCSTDTQNVPEEHFKVMALEQLILQLKEENAFLKKIIENWQNNHYPKRSNE